MGDLGVMESNDNYDSARAGERENPLEEVKGLEEEEK